MTADEILSRAREREAARAERNRADEIGAWPDDWARWQRALDDVFPVFQAPDLQDLR